MAIYRRNQSTQTKTADSNDIVEQIQNKAYELYVKRGYTDGNDLKDWFEAERIVKKETSWR